MAGSEEIWIGVGTSVAWTSILLLYRRLVQQTAASDGRKHWANIGMILPLAVAVDSALRLLYYVLYQTRTQSCHGVVGQWALLVSMICMLSHLAARAAFNIIFILQVKHYSLLRGYFTREEWRTVIGMAMFTSIADLSLRDGGGIEVSKTHVMLAAAGCSLVFYGYLLSSTVAINARLRRHLHLIRKCAIDSHEEGSGQSDSVQAKVDRMHVFLETDLLQVAGMAVSVGVVAGGIVFDVQWLAEQLEYATLLALIITGILLARPQA